MLGEEQREARALDLPKRRGVLRGDFAGLLQFGGREVRLIMRLRQGHRRLSCIHPRLRKGITRASHLSQLLHELLNGTTSDKAKTDPRYCVWDEAVGTYLYTEDWVAFLAEEYRDESKQRSLYE